MFGPARSTRRSPICCPRRSRRLHGRDSRSIARVWHPQDRLCPCSRLLTRTVAVVPHAQRHSQVGFCPGTRGACAGTVHDPNCRPVKSAVIGMGRVPAVGVGVCAHCSACCARSRYALRCLRARLSCAVSVTTRSHASPRRHAVAPSRHRAARPHIDDPTPLREPCLSPPSARACPALGHKARCARRHRESPSTRECPSSATRWSSVRVGAASGTALLEFPGRSTHDRSR